MNTVPATAADFLRDIAASLDCVIEDDLCALAKVEAGTAENWRKRGTGPAYIRFGNAFLYPRPALREHLLEKVRSRNTAPMRDAL